VDVPVECYAVGGKLSGSDHTYKYGNKLVPILYFKTSKGQVLKDDEIKNPTKATDLMKCAVMGAHPANISKPELTARFGSSQAYIHLVEKYDNSKTLEDLFPKPLRNTIIYTPEEYEEYLKKEGAPNVPVHIPHEEKKKPQFLRRKKLVPAPPIQHQATPTGQYVEHEDTEEESPHGQFGYENVIQYNQGEFTSNTEPEYGDQQTCYQTEEYGEESHTPSLEEQLFEGLNEPTPMTDTEKRKRLLDIFRQYGEDGQISLLTAAGKYLHHNDELQNLHLH
jgi:hypothetical protein